MGPTELGIVGLLLLFLFGGKKLTNKNNKKTAVKTNYSSIKPRAKASYEPLEKEYPEPMNESSKSSGA